MQAKVKSAAALAKEAADAAAAAGGTLEDSFEDAQDDVTTGISKDLLAYMKMQEKIRKEEAVRQDKIRQEERAYADMLRRDDLERMENERHQLQKAHELQIKMLTEQMSKQHDSSSSKSQAKMPMFDLDKDSESFPLWRSRWLLFVKGQKFDLIKDRHDRNTRVMMELTAALSDHTLAWLISKDFNEAQMDDPEFLIKALEAKIAKSSNPLIHQVELIQISQFAHESTDSLVQRIQEKARKCEFKSINNITDHQCLITLLQAVPTEIRQKLFLAKVKTFEEAVEIVQNEERAKSDAKSCSTTSSAQGEGNAMSGYKKGKKEEAKMADDMPPNFKCIRCLKSGHWPRSCPSKYENCNKCHKPGHREVACDTRVWTQPGTNPSGASAYSCKAYSVADMAAVAASHKLCAEHNARVEAYGSAFGPGEGNLDTL